MLPESNNQSFDCILRPQEQAENLASLLQHHKSFSKEAAISAVASSAIVSQMRTALSASQRQRLNTLMRKGAEQFGKKGVASNHLRA